MSTIWLRISRDKYELPEVVAGTAQELADLCGVTRNSLVSHMCHAKAGGYWCRYIKVEVEDEDEPEK